MINQVVKLWPWMRTSVSLVTTGRRLIISPQFSLVRNMSADIQSQFENAKKKLDTLKESPGNDVKLKIYGLFKQASVGKCNTSRPSMVDFVGKAKWDAWNSLGNITQNEAKQAYVKLIDDLVGSEVNTAGAAAESTPSGKYTGLIYTSKNGIATIMLNRPKKKNAITKKMYSEIGDALTEAANDKSVKFAVFTGAGDFYCSGNDLSNFTEGGITDIEKTAKDAGVLLRDYVAHYIDFPKPLVALVNGPAVGISVTVLGLFDIVYASDSATFHTPFSALGQSPEGCSSYVFPTLMGLARANEFLMLGRMFNAAEAREAGLVTEVFPAQSFRKETALRLDAMNKLPARSLLNAKQVYRNMQKDILHKVNKEECENLVERWQSEDCMNAVMAFLSKKSKL